MLNPATMLLRAIVVCSAAGACTRQPVIRSSPRHVDDGGVVRITHLYRSDRSRVGEPLRLVIDTAAAFDSLLDRLGRESVPNPESIDFEANEVIVAALGGQPAAGPSIAVDSVIDRFDRRTIVVTHTDYRNGCTLASAVTRPIDVAMVPKSHNSHVTFVERTRVLPCPF